MGSCGRCNGSCIGQRPNHCRYGCGVPSCLIREGYLCRRCVIDVSVPTRRWWLMRVQAHSAQVIDAGPCSDCGATVERRMVCVDHVTHSTVDLCAFCWNAYRQREMFAAGCC